MANGDAIAYNIATFVSTLFLLEFGADKFVDHTAIVARRTRIPGTIIALLTAGAEWEELIVVISSLAQGRSSLAVGNIIGSAISNILGAFSLGLLFVITSFVTPVTYFHRRTIWLACGAILIAAFTVYVISISWAISKGSLIAPEDSDDDNSDDDGNTDSARTSIDEEGSESRETDALLNHDGNSATGPLSQQHSLHRRSLGYHISYLVLGFLSICLAGYVLAHAATNIADGIGISDVLFGVIILSVATTLPEKFVAVISGHRGQIGILVANTVGSNIFLLSLCMGIIMLDTSGEFNGSNVNITELAVLWGSTLAFTLTVWFGGRFDRWIGGAMLACYAAFIVLEFTVIHNITDRP
uniref:Sodium/calcium exchanger membrane region domain-containing protein n=1 Tax=Bionectria ochroleuca TaxID=29856 RepID=A0A8H7N6B6_BIOOC